MLRSEPGVYGRVTSDATVARAIDTLAMDAPAGAEGDQQRAGRGDPAQAGWGARPDFGATATAPLVVDVDATLITAHSDKEQARPTFKRGYGHHPLWAFADHGPDGTGEPLACCCASGTPAAIPPPII